MSDAYATLREQQFLKALQTPGDIDDLARAVIGLVAPVQAVAIEQGGKQTGYRLRYENTYWAGYEQLDATEIDRMRLCCRKLALPNLLRTGASLYVEPLRDIQFFDPEFSFRRIENCVAQFIRFSPAPGGALALTLQQVRAIADGLDHYVREEKASLAKWRQHYVVDRVIKSWQAGNVNIRNNELKVFLEAKVGHSLKNGYQISSYIKEIDATFEQKLKISKTRTGVMLTWSHWQ